MKLRISERNELKLHEGDLELYSEPEYIGPYGDDGWETNDDDYYNFKQLGLKTVRDVVDFYKDLSKRQIVARRGAYGVLGDIDWNVRHGYWDDRNTQAVIDALDSDPSFKFYGESLKRNKSKRLREQDVEIEVKNKGILEVPEDKNVDDLPMSHFEKLVKKHGLSKITKALNNLQVWNKNDDKKLSKWAGNMIDKLNKKFKKDESIKEYYIGSEYGEYFDEYSLRQRYNTLMALDKLDDIINLYHDLGGDFDEFAIEATERGFSKIDIFTVGLCVEGIPVKEIEKRLRMLHLMDESISRKRFNEGWHNGDAVITFTHNDDLEADLEEFLYDLFSDNPDVFDFDWSGKYTNLYLACSKDDYDYIEWFINDWKYKHRDEYDESLKEYYDAQDFDRGIEDMFNYDGSDMYDDIPDEPYTEEDEFNYYVDYVYNNTRNPQEATRYLRSEGKSKEYIDQVIAAVDEIYG